ncbi:MAG: hypothetical protein LBN27_10450 [Prevotellaceae bacterium]|jgi:hypothetical protein|nr:hypothetical protein [Prevotellaceae bacterium]
MKKILFYLMLALSVATTASMMTACGDDKDKEEPKPTPQPQPTSHVFKYNLSRANNCGMPEEFAPIISLSDSAINVNKADKMSAELVCTDLVGTSAGTIISNVGRVHKAALLHGLELPPIEVWLNENGYLNCVDTLRSINITAKIKQ